LVKSIPMKIRGIHSCIDPSSSRLVEQFLRFRDLWQSKSKRAHSRTHLGRWVECRYALMSFGIPEACLPLDSSGEGLQRQEHMEWLRRQERLDDEEKRGGEMMSGAGISSACTPDSASIVSYPFHSPFPNTTTVNQPKLALKTAKLITNPAPNDVLFGRGRQIQEHQGNVAFTSLVHSFYPEYDQLSGKKEKTDFSQRIVTHFQATTGGRFLKPSSLDSCSQWEEAGNNAARSKVSYAFRSWRFRLQESRKPRKEENQTTTSSSSSGFFSSCLVGTAATTSLAKSTKSDRDGGNQHMRWTNL
jgi:hypothetical protein